MIKLSIERRKKLRVENENLSVFVEVEHSFGPIKKSVYQVLEYNDSGLSFSVPAKDGYFMVDTPIKYTLIVNETKNEQYGRVRYYTPFYNLKGEKFYKIGVEVKSNYRDISSRNFKLRPTRYSLGKSNPIVKIKNGKEFIDCQLIDISKYSAAFYADFSQKYDFRIGSVITDFKVVVKERTVFDGSVIINKIEDSKSNGLKVVVQPRGSLFSIESIEQIEKLETVEDKVKGLMRTINLQNKIDNKFKVLVSEIRLFLEKYDKFLQNSEFSKMSEKHTVELLDSLLKYFTPQMEKYLKEIDKRVKNQKADDEEHFLYKMFFQEQLHHLLMPSPFLHRIYTKPLGYPGDYGMMLDIYKNEYEGPTLFAKLLNKFTTGISMGVSNRNRNVYLCKKIVELVRSINKPEVKIISIASGPALEWHYILKDRTIDSNRINLTLLDQEIEALKYSQERIYEERIKYNSEIKVDFINRNIGAFIKDTAKDKSSKYVYDIIYSFGLFDYFDDKTAIKLLERLSNYLLPGGTLMISNFSMDGHSHKSYCELAFEWYMVYRGREELEKLAKTVKGVKSWTIEEDKTKVIKYLILRF